MSAALERSLAMLELLAAHPQGCALSFLAARIGMPLSATHRLLAALCVSGYVKQKRDQGDYVLTMKLVSLGLGFLSNSGVVDIAQPMLDRLAQDAGELVRLGVVDADELTFVAKAQGATRGLRYDPDVGLSVRLSCSSAGHAWLSTLSDEQALALVTKQGFGMPADYGPQAPTTVQALLACLEKTRRRGYSTIVEAFAPGMSAMAAPMRRNGETIGVVTIAGPLIRLSEARMLALGPALLETAQEIAAASGVSPLFRKNPS